MTRQDATRVDAINAGLGAQVLTLSADATRSKEVNADLQLQLEVLAEQVSLFDDTAATPESVAVTSQLKADLDQSRQDLEESRLALRRTQDDVMNQMEAVSKMNDVEREVMVAEHRQALAQVKASLAAAASGEKDLPPVTPSKASWSTAGSNATPKRSPDSNARDMSELHLASVAKLNAVEKKAKEEKEALETIIVQLKVELSGYQERETF